MAEHLAAEVALALPAEAMAVCNREARLEGWW